MQIDDYAERTASTIEAWKGMNGQQARLSLHVENKTLADHVIVSSKPGSVLGVGDGRPE